MWDWSWSHSWVCKNQSNCVSIFSRLLVIFSLHVHLKYIPCIFAHTRMFISSFPHKCFVLKFFVFLILCSSLRLFSLVSYFHMNATFFQTFYSVTIFTYVALNYIGFYPHLVKNSYLIYSCPHQSSCLSNFLFLSSKYCSMIFVSFQSNYH